MRNNTGIQHLEYTGMPIPKAGHCHFFYFSEYYFSIYINALAI